MTNLEDLVFRFRWQTALILIGLALTAGGVYVFTVPTAPGLEIIEPKAQEDSSARVTVEISGAIYKPGVYSLSAGSRVDDLINLSEGFTDLADTTWVERYVNRAALLTDGQKLYIPGKNEQSNSLSDNSSGGDQGTNQVFGVGTSGMVNINTASQKELEALPGIGPVTAQKVIDNRPYSTISELVSKGAVKQSVFDENKDVLSVY